MFEGIQEIIKQSSFSVVEGAFVYAKVNSCVHQEQHFMVSRDKDEITVVTRIENLPSLDLIERNKDDYALIALNVSVPFYSVGFLATVSGAVADVGMNILIVSTYSKDYILVKIANLDRTCEVLTALGFSQHHDGAP